MATVFDSITAAINPLIAGIVGDMTTAVISILSIMVMILGIFVLRDVLLHRVQDDPDDSDSRKNDRPGSYHS